MSSAVYKCSFCDAEYSTRGGKRYHEINKHPELFKPKQTQSSHGRICGICRLKQRNINELCTHVSETHELPAEVKEWRFETESEFEKWKAEIERKQLVGFSLTHNEKGYGKKLFTCHRSGSYTPTAGKTAKGRAPKDTPTIKVGFDCTAFIRVETNDGVLHVTACLDHYNHDISAKHLRLSSHTQSKMYQMLKDDRTPGYIAEKLGEHGEGRERLVRAQDVRNIQRKFGAKEYEKDKNDATSVDLWVSEMEKEFGIDRSPFFAYQPTQNSDPNTFRVGIQTESQRQMLISLGQKAIMIDDTHDLTQYDFKLVTVEVIDENGNGFPVAWLITKRTDADWLIPFFQELYRRCVTVVIALLITFFTSMHMLADVETSTPRISCPTALTTSGMHGYLRQVEKPMVADSHRLAEMHKNHRAYLRMNMDAEVIEAVEWDQNDSPISWTIPSSTRQGEFYMVKVANFQCDCRVRCRFLGCDVCPENYQCSCISGVKAQSSSACKHIHMVHSSLFQCVTDKPNTDGPRFTRDTYHGFANEVLPVAEGFQEQPEEGEERCWEDEKKKILSDLEELSHTLREIPASNRVLYPTVKEKVSQLGLFIKTQAGAENFVVTRKIQPSENFQKQVPLFKKKQKQQKKRYIDDSD